MAVQMTLAGGVETVARYFVDGSTIDEVLPMHVIPAQAGICASGIADGDADEVVNVGTATSEYALNSPVGWAVPTRKTKPPITAI